MTSPVSPSVYLALKRKQHDWPQWRVPDVIGRGKCTSRPTMTVSNLHAIGTVIGSVLIAACIISITE
jgi:hypothetical protein